MSGLPLHAIHSYDRYNPLPPTRERAEIARLREVHRQAKLDIHVTICQRELGINPQFSVTMHCLAFSNLTFRDMEEIKQKLADSAQGEE